MGIISTAAELGQHEAMLIVSRTEHGRSRLAIEEAKKYDKVLYVAFAAPSKDVPDTWHAVRIFDSTGLAKLIMEATKEKYDCIILDDFHNALDYYAPDARPPELREYNGMAIQWNTALRKLLPIASRLIVTLSVVEEQDPNGTTGWRLSIIPAAYKRAIDQFSHRWYVERGINTSTNKPAFIVQKDGILAMQFSSKGASKFVLDTEA